MYGTYSLEDLTVSSTARALGLDNRPVSSRHFDNLELTNRFLQSLPFGVTITSVYRSPAVNSAVGGSSSSQHMNGLGMDLVPHGMSNEELATWLWANRASYPELDQVIWYTHKAHVHIGICPVGATNCVSGAPRGRFYKARGEGSQYESWLPDDASLTDVMVVYAQARPRRFLALKILSLGLGFAGLVGLALMIRRRR